jgi:hypothetical protein
MSNIKYWLSVFIGFLLVLITYKYKPFGIETFAPQIVTDPSIGADVGNNNSSSTSGSGPSGSSGSGPSGSSGAPSNSGAPSSGGTPSSGRAPSGGSSAPSSSQSNGYCGSNILPLPYPTQLSLYFNSFNASSPVPGVGNMNTTYQCNGNKPNYWCDANNSSIQYFLNGQTPAPSSMPNGGLQMLNMMITGPPATSLVNTNITPLSSFSLVFYMKVNSITFTTPADIILYEMSAVTPNMVRVSISQITGDSNNVEVNIIVGPTAKIYSWTVPITTLLSGGNNTTFTIIYDTTSVPSQPTLSFYIGAGGNGNVWNMQSPGNIYLSDLGITINKNQNLDAALLAFCYYSCVLYANDVKTIDSYFLSEASGICALQNALSVTSSALSSQNSGLLNLLNSASSTIQTLETEIDKLSTVSCPAPKVITASAPTAPPPSGPMWQINMNGGSSVSDTDLQTCSPLTLQEFNISMPPSPMPNIQATANVVNKTLFASQPSASPSRAPVTAPSQAPSPYRAPVASPIQSPSPYSAPSQSPSLYSAPSQVPSSR